MSAVRPALPRCLMALLLSALLYCCSQPVGAVDPGEDPPEEPVPQATLFPSPTSPPVTLTPTPKGQAQFSISRSGTMTAGLGGTIEVSGAFPIDIYFSEAGQVGPEILFSTGAGTATMSVLGEGLVGTGEMIGVWDVIFEVVGVFKPAPECSLALSITERWQPGIEVTALVNGEQIMVGEGESEFIVWANDVHEFGNIKFPLGIGIMVEDYLEPTTDWINTYQVTSLQVPEFTGCLIAVEPAKP